jgi:hypothetical protein
MYRIRLRVGILAAVLAVAMLGCSTGTRPVIPNSGITVEGTVTYGKDKIPAALVIFVGTDSSVTAMIGEDGRYKADNVPLGEVSIGVNTKAAEGMSHSPGYKGPKVIPVPAKYHDPSKSGLKTTIESSTNTYDIVIPK